MSDVTDTPAQASGTTAALALLAMLTERYPATFRHEGAPYTLCMSSIPTSVPCAASNDLNPNSGCVTRFTPR